MTTARNRSSTLRGFELRVKPDEAADGTRVFDCGDAVGLLWNRGGKQRFERLSASVKKLKAPGMWLMLGIQRTALSLARSKGRDLARDIASAQGWWVLWRRMDDAGIHTSPALMRRAANLAREASRRPLDAQAVSEIEALRDWVRLPEKDLIAAFAVPMHAADVKLAADVQHDLRKAFERDRKKDSHQRSVLRHSSERHDPRARRVHAVAADTGFDEMRAALEFKGKRVGPLTVTSSVTASSVLKVTITSRRSVRRVAWGRVPLTAGIAGRWTLKLKPDDLSAAQRRRRKLIITCHDGQTYTVSY